MTIILLRMSAVCRWGEMLWEAAWLGRGVVVRGDSPQELCVHPWQQPPRHSQCDCFRTARAGHHGYGFRGFEVIVVALGYCPEFPSLHKFPQMDLSIPGLTKGFWISIKPWGVTNGLVNSSLGVFTVHYSVLFLYCRLSHSSVQLNRYFMQTFQWKKRGHILEGCTFGDQITESISWQKIQKH